VPEFVYKAINEDGKIISGKMSALSEVDLESKLIQKGLVLVKCRKTKETLLLRFGRVKSKFIIELYSRLAQALEIGLPLISALNEIGKTIPSNILRRVVEDISLSIQSGNTLYDAMSAFPRIFNKLELNVIKMGEKSGTLPFCLTELAEFLEWREDIKSTIKKAAIYPSFIIVLVSGVVGVWIGYVLPQMAQLLMEMGVKLPITTIFILKISIFMKAYWISILIIIGSILMFLIIFTKTSHGKKIAHKYILKFPLLGNIFMNLCLARLSNNFAIMYKAGVPIKEIFEILIDHSLGNLFIEEKLALVFQYIQSGQHISEALEKVEIFPVLFIGAVKNGEFTGTLDNSFKRLAHYYDKEVKDRVQSLISIIEPMTMIILGGVFGLVALSILLPLYNLIGTLGKNY